MTSTTSRCPADYDRDDRPRTRQDLEAFIADFEAGNPIADVNGDQFIDFFDFEQFVYVFSSYAC